MPLWRKSNVIYNGNIRSAQNNKNTQNSNSLSLNNFFSCLLQVGTICLFIHYFLSSIYIKNLSLELGLTDQNIYSFDDLLTTYIAANYHLISLFTTILYMSFIIYFQMYVTLIGVQLNIKTIYTKLVTLINKRIKSKTLSMVIFWIAITSLTIAFIALSYYISDSIYAVIIEVLFVVFGFLGAWRKNVKYVVIGIVASIIVSTFYLAFTSKDFFKIEDCTDYVELEFNDNTIVTTNDTVRMAYHGSKYVVFRNIPDSTSTLYSTSSIKRITEKANFYPTKKN